MEGTAAVNWLVLSMTRSSSTVSVLDLRLCIVDMLVADHVGAGVPHSVIGPANGNDELVRRS